MGRRGVLVFVFTLVSGLIWTFAPVRANPVTEHEDGFAQRANAERSAAGLAPFAGAADLVEVARRHAQRMASEQRLHHNPALSSEVQGWQAVGENVGVGSSVESIHRAFMASPTHRDNLLSRTFTEAGMGVHVDGEGSIWVAQVFRKPEAAPSSGSAGSAGSAPAPAPAPAPAEKKPAEVRASRAPQPAPPAPAPAAPAAPAAASVAVESAAPATPSLVATPAADAEVAAMAEAFAAGAVDATVVPRPIEGRPTTVSSAAGSVEAAVVVVDERRVTLPVGVAASFLLAVVLGLLAEVGRYPLSDWRRQRNQASMSSSRSPSSTAWTLPVS